MSEPTANFVDVRVETRRAAARTGRDGARSWTGRSVVSNVTDRIRPRYATAGMHRTRVSGMRLLASRPGMARARRDAAGPVTTPILRRSPPSPFGISG